MPYNYPRTVNGDGQACSRHIPHTIASGPSADLPFALAGPTLLPQTIASLVSAISIATRISIRSAALLIEGIIESIRLGTLVGLGLTRRALIAAVSSARTMHFIAQGLDWTGKAGTAQERAVLADKDENKFLAVLDHYTNVGVYVITHAFTLAELFSIAGLSFTSSVASLGFTAAEESVRMLDGLLGSGETSRALAAIISLARSELTDDPDFAAISSQGPITTLITLTRTLTAFVCLQAATRKRTARETRMRVIYDCTVLDEGQGFMNDVAEHAEDEEAADVVQTEEVTTSQRRSRSTSVAVHMAHASSADTQAQKIVGTDEEEEAKIFQELARLCGDGVETEQTDDLPMAVQRALNEFEERASSVTLGNRLDFEIEVSQSRTTTTTIVRAVNDTSLVNDPALGSQLDGYCWEQLNGSEAAREETSLVVENMAPDDLCGKDELAIEGKRRFQVVLKTITKKLTQRTRTIRTVGKEHIGHEYDDDEIFSAQSTPKAKQRPSVPGGWPAESEASSPELKSTNQGVLRPIANAFRKVTGGEGPATMARRSSVTSARRATPTASPAGNSPNLSPILAPVSPTHSRRHSRQHSASSFRLEDSRTSGMTSHDAESGRGQTTCSSPHLRRAPSLHSIQSIVTTCKHRPATSSEEAEPKASNFPRRHLVENLQTFMRYSSAAYGQAFLRIMGLGRSRGLDFTFPDTRMPADNHAFAHHAGVPVEDILLDTYSDTQGGVFENEKISPIVNYVAVDHGREAVVLSCRGSLGLSDLLVDLTCSYEPIHVPNGDPAGHYYVHAGMWHSATRMQRGLVHEKIKQALLSYPSYGLVLCGHSLGGGVAALLSILWACPISVFERFKASAGLVASHPAISTAFVTSPTSGLPAGRPIKCYAYGPPCVASLDLQEYCRGLVISTVHNNDVVPTLSLGLLRDLKTTALNLHEDEHRGTTQEIIGRVVGVWQSQAKRTRVPVESQPKPRCLPSMNPLTMASYGIGSFYDTSEEAKSVALTRAELVAGRGSNKALDPAYCDPALLDPELTEELVVNDYLWSIMRTLRASNDNDKLYPPGDAYVVENFTVFVSSESNKTQYSRREGRRILLRAVDDTVKRFSEPVFGKSLFLDHSPTEYEHNLDLLAKAVLG
ncbi:hypothetical protein OIV83_002415 [Microbotryomycetes sp. JL201]|nr:hypothetical protein OIV83_002415 [Microbotryomycetes sp. JL201]